MTWEILNESKIPYALSLFGGERGGGETVTALVIVKVVGEERAAPRK